MEQHNVTRNGEQEISLVGVFFHVLKKWRALVALLLIGEIAGCAVSFLMLKRDDRAILEKKVKSFTAEQIDKEKVRQYADYVALYNSQIEHTTILCF